MAPKQQHHQQQKFSTKGSASKSKPQPSGAEQGPKLQISAENEQRLRRLLLNTERPAPAPPPPGSADNVPRAQKVKKLRSVYDKLSLEGFTPEQIEGALSALGDGATFEFALDWLCLNIHGNELPLKFSSGAFTSGACEGVGRYVQIISTSQDDWIPSQRAKDDVKGECSRISVRTKSNSKESLDLGVSSQADWVRRYMEQQEEEEEHMQIEELSPQESHDGVSYNQDSIAREYHNARLAALEAKQNKDHVKHEHFGGIIRDLRQRMASLGLSDDVLLSGLQNESSVGTLPENNICKSNICEPQETNASKNGGISPVSDPFKDGLTVCDGLGKSSITERSDYVGSLNVANNEKVSEEKDLPVDIMELDNLFSEDANLEILPTDNLKSKKEKSLQFGYGYLLGGIDDLCRKGDSEMIPKAALQKLCQRLGWEAPKYNKIYEKENTFAYVVTILRTPTGRGRSRKAGGLIALQLPDANKLCTSAEDAQNKVASFALSCLFSDIPIHRLLVEPYASLAKEWQQDGSSSELDEETRRTNFVDSLLNTVTPVPLAPRDIMNASLLEKVGELCNSKKEGLGPQLQKNDRWNYHKIAESNALKQQLENQKRLPEYMDMLKKRDALPIYHLKNHLLELLRETDVVVVCGETGCGKTTQVPQFVLDDMIESNLGGYSNIICTQPRRIAAISVAERVSVERCEPPPSYGCSLVGFQVRFESARNDRTKLLFCTTGILLRKLAGDNELAGVTHVIVDEVHERSLLGDFLLIVLKNLIERRSANGAKLKVILMSATVDSALFQRYFGRCPVITAEGRTHTVATYFLEDVYEKLNYCLPSDSPAFGKRSASSRRKLRSDSVDNHRGKKNLVLAAWGDESQLYVDYVNPHYFASAYQTYSEKTRQNLKNLNEDAIDYDLLEDLICFIDENYPGGAILVFLPGLAEINVLVDQLIATYRFGGSSADWIIPLHSSLASADQRKVFLSPPESIRKIIVATDIAETCITIDDVVYVIDTGKHKEKRYNPQKKMSSMVEDWISRANAKQRRGRAGRVKPGICFCLYTQHRFDSLMGSFQVPEILRMPLAELCLQIKSLSFGNVKAFLSQAIEPPSEAAVNSAITLLYEVGAVEGNEELTALGYHLAKLPVDVLIGKMMLYGAIFGCLSPILSIAAFLSYKLPFVHPKKEKKNVESAKLTGKQDDGADLNEYNMQSDHLLLVAAYEKWSRTLNEKGTKAAQNFCRSFFLSSSVMYMIRDMRIQFGSLLVDIGIINLPSVTMNEAKSKHMLDEWFSDMTQPFNANAPHPSIVRSILCAGLYPNIAASNEGIAGTSLVRNRAFGNEVVAKDHLHWCDGKREVHIHPSSTNFNLKKFQYPFLVYLEKIETSKIFLRDTSVVSPYCILLFGGSINIHHQTGIVTIDGWLKVKAPAQIAVLFKELRATLHAVLKELIRKPEMTTALNNEVVKSIVQLLLDEGKAQHQ